MNSLKQNFVGNIKKKTYPNGSKYEGGLHIDGKKKGKGIITF